MKIIRLMFTFCIFAVFWTASLAGPKEDSETIADYLTDVDRFPDIAQVIVLPFERSLTAQLQSRSIEVVDSEQFQNLLIGAILEIELDKKRRAFVEQSHTANRNDLARLADIIRAGQSDKPEEQIQQPRFTEEYVLQTLVQDDGALVDAIVRMNGIKADFNRFADAIYRNNISKPDLMSEYMIEILKIDGVFRFPNRIWQQDLIRSIKIANSSQN